MTPTDPPAIGRLYDLLARRATEPLAPAEEAELREVQAKWPHVEPDEMDAVAALIQAATATPSEPPADVMFRLESAAVAPHTRPARPRAGRRWPWGATVGWAVAACLLVVVGLLARDRWGRTTSPVAEREKLLTSGAKRFPAKPVETLTGDVVWDTATQRGVLSVTGLPPNDPARKQYQLWIVDAGRTHKEPVDGGVFDVGPDGRAVVAIKPALAIRNPVLFAVTEEPPGGVVVSERGREGKFEVVFGE